MRRLWKVEEGRASSRKAGQRENREQEWVSLKKASQEFDGHSANKRNGKSRNILKREGDREKKHKRRIEIDKGNMEKV
jgi:hypothetical protein